MSSNVNVNVNIRLYLNFRLIYYLPAAYIQTLRNLTLKLKSKLTQTQ